MRNITQSCVFIRGIGRIEIDNTAEGQAIQKSEKQYGRNKKQQLEDGVLTEKYNDRRSCCGSDIVYIGIIC